jgi:hypothetical protein
MWPLSVLVLRFRKPQFSRTRRSLSASGIAHQIGRSHFSELYLYTSRRPLFVGSCRRAKPLNSRQTEGHFRANYCQRGEGPSAVCFQVAGDIEDSRGEDQEGEVYDRGVVLVHHPVQGEPSCLVFGGLSLESVDEEQDVGVLFRHRALLSIVGAQIEHIAKDRRVGGEEEAVDGHFLVVRGGEDD